MPISGTHRLRSIKTLHQLLVYLNEELDWPVDTDEVDNAYFEYTPEEIGLDAEQAAKIKHIKQLRPFHPKQPWGIFFVEFEKKKLPVAVLRRILSHLVVKRRTKASKSQAASWQADDLLFISAFGDEETSEREIAFAHFHQEQGDLPTLRVLGWDGADTPLKLEHVDASLHNYLRWPKNPGDLEGWRKQWSAPFRHRLNHVIQTADALAEVLASLARKIRDAAKTLLRVESQKGQLRRLHQAFQTALIHDLTEVDFADTYAQTITYGLLTAAISRTEMSEGRHGTALVADNLTEMVPITNPFLREMLETFIQAGGRKGGIDFDELGIQDVVDLLRGDETDLPAILRDFGNKTRGEDPVIHFYEHFLAAYNKKLKVQRGVFYTPQPVVSYIVRSVHELLKSEFGIEDGLASTITWGEMASRHASIEVPDGVKLTDTFVNILDPAVGTATFLIEVIDVIHKTLNSKWQKEGKLDRDIQRLWNDYVPTHLLPRLHGYELMMASYAIAHMKLPLKLQETGFTAWDKLSGTSRARIYLTNALEPAQDFSDRLAFDAPALAHEAQSVNAVKQDQRFTVIIGNPPYSNYSANLSAEARRIVDKYRSFRGLPIRERNQLQFERNIQDDFVKFVSVGQDIINAAGCGVFGYITSATMLGSRSLRGMRESLLGSFNKLYELNLHGGVNEIIEGVENDENVFDIAQSVAIHVYVRSKPRGTLSVHYADLTGRRLSKYYTLASGSVERTAWQQFAPDEDNCTFSHQDEDVGGRTRRLDSLFVKFGAGIKTNQDAVVVAFDDSSLLEAIRKANPTLAQMANVKTHIHPILYRPFDIRKIFYHEDMVASRSLPTMKHIIAGPNIGFISCSTWTTPERFSVGISRLMVEMKTGTHDRGTTFFPLYRYETFLGGKPEKTHNLTQDFLDEWCLTTRTQFVALGRGDKEGWTGPEDVLLYLYGLFHSPEYRRRHRNALSKRFPIVLLTSNRSLLRLLTQLGGELASLHLLESPKLSRSITEFVGNRDIAVEKVSWSQNSVWLDKDQTVGFRSVPAAVWNLHIAGYQVCEKWLKDRKGRKLSKADIEHYQKILVALNETLRLMKEIDEVIEKHGGWPVAFA